ncbi:MAG: hypothetical protein MJE68_28235, partial [Proteobacteria bacterium]|nr:hypothetical protein [Pseudomonadota bacterium]
MGFDYTTAACRSSEKNLPSVREQPQIVGDYLAEECAQGRILGPFDPKSFPQVLSTPGKWCLIVDLSSPRGGGGAGG